MSPLDVLQRLDAKKAKLDHARPLPHASVQSLLQDFRVRYAHETTALEGNTLTLRETQVVLEHGITIAGKPLRDHLEVINANDALDWLTVALDSKEPVSERTILRFHSMLMKGILQDEAGLYRRAPVFIRGAAHVPPNWRKVPELMAEFESWLKKATDVHPIVLAARAHIRLSRIHPFTDGNGRTCRLLVNYILMQHGYPPALYTAGERVSYLNALREADEGNEEAFVKVTAAAAEWTLDRYLALVEETVHDKPAPSASRKRTRTCSVRCQTSSAPVSTCRCVCDGKNHGSTAHRRSPE